MATDVTGKEEKYQSRLYEAITARKLKDVENLLTSGYCDPNKCNLGSNKSSPLHLAIDYDFMELVRILLNRNVHLEAKNKYGQTALDVAAGLGYRDMVRALLEAGADVNCERQDRTTPLYMAAQEGHREVVETLVEAGANLAKATLDGDTPLHAATRNSHLDIVKFLHKFGANIHKENTFGATPLDTASFNGHNDVVAFLLDAGAVVDYKRKDDSTPLYVAAQQGHAKVMKTLIDHGADVNAQDKNGATPLFAAAQQGHVDAAKLLLAEGADPLIQKEGKWTPLHIAKLNHKPEIVSLLTGKNRHEASHKDGRKPPYKSASTGTPGVTVKSPGLKEVEVTRKRAQTTLPLEKDRDIPSSLLWAVRLGDLTTVQCILMRKCDVSYMKYEGQTAYDEAVLRGRPDLAEAIVDRCKEVLREFAKGESRRCFQYWRVIARHLDVDYDDVEDEILDEDEGDVAMGNIQELMCYRVFLRWIDNQRHWPDIDAIRRVVDEIEDAI
ncbi:ankyrin repeat domain-containing protein 29-like isoform X2 [Ptychodera flava]|uniref:ankyrin repeat domain-containing protein 29-like isoform X2 n=1 Tax=Ptychodera flava TaxID=63121 RepID=UPI00396A6071